ncbi:unnamed protein product [Pleuronectes platessa]|uniref:Uncharacterized protein n=1 Tax=Pleuronectes platessa TaxID=8262 RepID=A0A9N7TMN2_PLEPL|nr:unnamed protein product [Pleuronectes platessa]
MPDAEASTKPPDHTVKPLKQTLPFDTDRKPAAQLLPLLSCRGSARKMCPSKRVEGWSGSQITSTPPRAEATPRVHLHVARCLDRHVHVSISTTWMCEGC